MGLRRALTIAGSDPSGGAGVQADLKVFTSLGVYGMAVVTSLTVQNTLGVKARYDVPPQVVYEQIRAVLEDIGADAVKTGMLATAGIVSEVAKALKEFRIERLIVDPIILSESGYPLLDEEAREVLVRELFPRALLVTPNVPEAQALCGRHLEKLRDIEDCAKEIFNLGPRAVLIKGGHREGKKVIDVLYTGGEEIHYFVYDRVETKNTHGTGCTLSSAITALLAKGVDFYEAIRKARFYLQKALESSYDLGRGRGPLNHLWNVERCAEDFLLTED